MVPILFFAATRKGARTPRLLIYGPTPPPPISLTRIR